jgi:hypothetical protein
VAQYAKKVKDLVDDLGICVTIDRTKQEHRYPYDVDVRSPSAPPAKRCWIYWGSHRSVEACRKKIRGDVKSSLGSDAQARIVEAKTGKVLEVHRT